MLLHTVAKALSLDAGLRERSSKLQSCCGTVTNPGRFSSPGDTSCSGDDADEEEGEGETVMSAEAE